MRRIAEVFHRSFTFAVKSRGDMKCTSSLLLAVKSYLSKVQVCSQLFHDACCDKRLIAAYSKKRSVKWQLNRRCWVLHHITGDKKPSPWSQRKLTVMLRPSSSRKYKILLLDTSTYSYNLFNTRDNMTKLIWRLCLKVLNILWAIYDTTCFDMCESSVTPLSHFYNCVRRWKNAT